VVAPLQLLWFAIVATLLPAPRGGKARDAARGGAGRPRLLRVLAVYVKYLRTCRPEGRSRELLGARAGMRV